MAARTSSAWPSGFTLSNRAATLTSGPITKVVRATPMYVRPYIDFSCQQPYAAQIRGGFAPAGSSARSANGRRNLRAKRPWLAAPSGLTPSTSAPALRKRAHASRKPHASTVHPGVSSLG